MSTPETKVKDRVKAEIAEACAMHGYKARIDWHAGTSFNITLDGTGCIAGHPVVIEIKRLDKKGKVTARQKMNLKEFRDAGAAAFLIDSEEALAGFRVWLHTLTPRTAYYG